MEKRLRATLGAVLATLMGALPANAAAPAYPAMAPIAQYRRKMAGT
jgi:hypothetical protein